jgi:cell volume regulation protein A
MMPEASLTIAAVLLMLGVLSSLASSRLGVPALVLFLIVGMLAGTDGPGHVPFDDAYLAQLLGVAALALILFDGGLNTHWRQIRPILGPGLLLATLGVIGTTVLVGSFATYLLHLDWHYGLLLGAIVSSTDAAAVFSILKSGSNQLKNHLQPLLELESALNDPMAACLTLGLVHLIQNPHSSGWALLLLFIQQMSIGSLAGWLFGKGIIWVIDRVKLEYEGLYAVLTLGTVLFLYGITALCHGSGFLAVYIVGLMMSHTDFAYKKSLLRFHESLAWLMQIVMFLALGLLALPSRLPRIAGSGLLIALFLIFIARPVSVFLALSFSRFTVREKLMISWVGLRGAVPIVLATFPLLAGLPQSTIFFDSVFFIVISSVLLQGTLLERVAHWLGVSSPITKKPRIPLEFIPAGKSSNDLIEILVTNDSLLVNQSIAELKLPGEVLIVLIGRGDEFIVPKGNMILEEDDILLVLADKSQLTEFCENVGTCIPIPH